jgi:hypothetical protein
MNSHIPLWEALLSLDSEYWFLTAPMVFGLLVLALRGPNWLGRFRWGGLIIAVPIAMPLALTGMVEASKLPLTRTLSRDEIVAGQLLYAGSVVRFRDWQHRYIQFIKLPRVTEIDGIPFTGRVGFASGGDTPGRWNGTLAADHVIDGWPCARGQIATRWGNKLLTCKLATSQVFFDFEVPAGTFVRGDWNSWSFELPPDKTLAIKALSTAAPAGSDVSVTSEGHLTRIRLKEGQTMIVHGVPLRANIEIVDGVLVGQIAEPYVIAGERRASDTKVSIDLAETSWPCADGKVRLRNGRSLWSCQLVSAHSFLEYDLPAGTQIERDEKYTWLALPAEKAIEIKSLSTIAPARGFLIAANDGPLRGIVLGAGQSIVVRGVPLKGRIRVFENAVLGELANSFVVAGMQQSVDTEVVIDRATGTVSLNLPDCGRVCPN